MFPTRSFPCNIDSLIKKEEIFFMETYFNCFRGIFLYMSKINHNNIPVYNKEELKQVTTLDKRKWK